MRQRFSEAIASAMVDGEFITKFVIIAEVIDSDGERCLWASANEEAQSWDILGLLQWGLSREMAATTLRLVAGATEEEEE